MILSEYSSRLTSRCCSAASNETEWHRNWSVNERRENMREKMLFFSSGFLLAVFDVSIEGARRISPRLPASSRFYPAFSYSRDSDIWEIYARLCVDSTLNHISRAADADDKDIESITPGYSQPAHR